MKVVVRSSSLLFTLLSIVLQAPIRRTKRPDTSTAASGEHDSHTETALALGAHRNNERIQPGTAKYGTPPLDRISKAG